MTEPLIVTQAEAGQKLLQWLDRRFAAPQGVLHRWIRSGQVRINGKRAKAFDRVALADQIRIPPFAEAQRTEAGTARNAGIACELPTLAAENEDLLVFNKPAGLPTHPGTGHRDSLTTRLAACYADAPFRPTPAHRLDKDTSGLLLVAKSYTALRRLADAFAAHDGRIVKEYLAWVEGIWPDKTPRLLEDRLAKQTLASPAKGLSAQQNKVLRRERVRVLQPGGISGTEQCSPKNAERESTGQENTGQENAWQVHACRKKGGPEKSDQEEAGKIARLTVHCVARKKGTSLLLIRLHTGRTHQIRAQLSSAGFPLIGDVKYGGPACRSGLKLHSARLRLDGTTYEALPTTNGPAAWRDAWAVETLPPPLDQNEWEGQSREGDQG